MPGVIFFVIHAMPMHQWVSYCQGSYTTTSHWGWDSLFAMTVCHKWNGHQLPTSSMHDIFTFYPENIQVLVDRHGPYMNDMGGMDQSAQIAEVP